MSIQQSGTQDNLASVLQYMLCLDDGIDSLLLSFASHSFEQAKDTACEMAVDSWEPDSDSEEPKAICTLYRQDEAATKQSSPVEVFIKVHHFILTADDLEPKDSFLGFGSDIDDQNAEDEDEEDYSDYSDDD